MGYFFATQRDAIGSRPFFFLYLLRLNSNVQAIFLPRL